MSNGAKRVAAARMARVLLVDDDPVLLRAHRRVLDSSSRDVLTATTPSEALSVLEMGAIDVVIADYRMAEMKGDEFLKRVRERWPDTVRILTSGYGSVEMIRSALRDCGIFLFLSKPCGRNELEESIELAIQERRVRQRRRQRSEKLELDLQSFQHLFRSSPDAMMIADLDGYVLDVNDAFVEQYGDSRDDAMRIRPYIIGDRSRWRIVKDELGDEGAWSTELDHELGRRLLTVSSIKDDSGEPYAYAAVERDITAQHRLQAAERSAQYEVILSLAKLAEFRDPETGAHLERMRRYSRILAREMSSWPRYKQVIDADFVESIFMSSPLHDIGKVGIPDAVLLKPGKLDPAERKVMETHALIGANVLVSTGASLAQKGWLQMAHTIALQHHEKFDGSGYPYGLSGEDIALPARLVALADAYDAITSKRVYKKALSHGVARQRIVESAGAHFDPDVVDAFLASEEEFIAVRARHQEDSATSAFAAVNVPLSPTAQPVASPAEPAAPPTETAAPLVVSDADAGDGSEASAEFDSSPTVSNLRDG